jgi:hypothetical protein
MTPFLQTEYEFLPIGTGLDINYSSSGYRYKVNNHLGRGGWASSSPANIHDEYFDPDWAYYVQKSAAAIVSSNWDALTFIAEIKHLHRMFNKTAGRLHRLMLDAASRRREIIRSVDDLHGLWLEGRYGWRTLSYDIRDLHEVLTSVNDRRSRFRRNSGFTTTTNVSKETDYPEPPYRDLVASEDMNLSCSVRGSVIADISVPSIQFNPVVTAWEVTKLSFVVDWLVNVGQAINAATFLLFARSYVAAGGYRTDISLNQTYGTVATYGTCVVHSEDYQASYKAHYEERIPTSVSAIPRLKLRLDVPKVLDLGALVAQALGIRFVRDTRRAVGYIKNGSTYTE